MTEALYVVGGIVIGLIVVGVLLRAAIHGAIGRGLNL
jgi:hypothetical protein